MTLGERQAYETGRKDGWQEAIVALASGAKKLLGPETVRTLVAALQAGLVDRAPAAADGDPTEPATWGSSPVADVQAHLQRFAVMESAPGVARDDTHRDFVHQRLAMPRGGAIGDDWHGTRPGDEDRHTVGEHR